MTLCSRVINIDQSPAAPYREICLIKLGKIIGVRLDGVNCPDDRRGCLSIAGKDSAGCPALPSRRRPPTALRGLPHPRGTAAHPGTHPEPLPVPRVRHPLAPPQFSRQLGWARDAHVTPFAAYRREQLLQTLPAFSSSPPFCFTLPDSDALFPSPRRHLGILSNRSPLLPNFPPFPG